MSCSSIARSIAAEIGDVAGDERHLRELVGPTDEPEAAGVAAKIERDDRDAFADERRTVQAPMQPSAPVTRNRS